MIEQKQTSYHHGNVKKELIDAALRLMENEDIEQISLRRLAREIGVTPPAVYNHFADKQTLMVAIKTRAFAELNIYFDEACTADPDPELELRDLLLAYFSFSQQNPARFNVLFRGDVSRSHISDDFLRMSCKTINRLRRVMLAIYQKYQVQCSEEQLVNQATLAWAQVHGLIVLRDSGSILATIGSEGWPRSCALQTDEDINSLLEILVDGVLTLIKHGGSTGQAVAPDNKAINSPSD